MQKLTYNSIITLQVNFGLTTVKNQNFEIRISFSKNNKHQDISFPQPAASAHGIATHVPWQQNVRKLRLYTMPYMLKEAKTP